MRYRSISRKQSQERGQTIALVALTIVTLLAMAALAIDVVTLYVAKGEVQRADDADALVAAKAFVDCEQRPEQWRQSIHRRHDGSRGDWRNQQGNPTTHSGLPNRRWRQCPLCCCSRIGDSSSRSVPAGNSDGDG